MVRGLMFLRERPEEAADIGVKRLQMAGANKSMLVDGIKRYIQALPQGVPGMPSPEGIKNLIEHEVRIPMMVEEAISPERLLHLKLVEEVRREIELKIPKR